MKNKSAGLNIKYSDKPLDCRGRNTPQSTYGRKLHEVPNIKIVDNYPKDKKYNFNIRIKRGNTYTYLYKMAEKEEKNNNAPAIFPNGITKEHRNEG
ncbi:MAG: hypothetical protein GY861_12710 [bacterium]|nr:hypothetical protein [bacterium]